VLSLYRNYIQAFSTAREPEAKKVAIDHLLHRFHCWVLHNMPTRPSAVNLIHRRQFVPLLLCRRSPALQLDAPGEILGSARDQRRLGPQ
jgi:hypothetical protein